MSTRFCLYVGGSLFAAAVALAFADQWVAAGVVATACTYVVGRWDHHRAVADLTAELTAVKARERRLDDELNDRCARRHVGNGGGHLSPSALSDRDSNTTAERGARPAVRAARLP